MYGTVKAMSIGQHVCRTHKQAYMVKDVWTHSGERYVHFIVLLAQECTKKLPTSITTYWLYSYTVTVHVCVCVC